MHLEGNAVVMDDRDVELMLRQIYTEVAEFLGEQPVRLIIPLQGAKVLGLAITVKKIDGL